MKRQRIAIFGCNPLSFELAKRLDTELLDIIFVDDHADKLEIAAKQGFLTTVIDYRQDDELRKIGVGSDIDILFCFLAEDSANVFLTISARGIDAKVSIIAAVEQAGSAHKLLAAGADKIIDPHKISGRKIHQLLTKPEITNLLDHTVFGRHDLNMAEIVIPLGSGLEQHQASSLNLETRYNLIFIGVVDKEAGNNLHFAIDSTTHTLTAGDVLVVLGPAHAIRAFKKDILTPTEDSS